MKKYLSASLATLFLATACANTTPPAATVSEDGLTLSANPTIDQLYIRSGVDFSRYQSLSLEPIKLTYSDEHRSKLAMLTDEDFQFSDKEMGTFQQRADKGFTKGIDKDSAQNGQLIVRSTIEDFYLTAPIKNNLHVPDKSFVQDSSRFKITTELIDTNTQQVVLRATDKIKTGDLSTNSSHLSRMTSVTYWQDVNRAFRRWGSRIKSAVE